PNPPARDLAEGGDVTVLGRGSGHGSASGEAKATTRSSGWRSADSVSFAAHPIAARPRVVSVNVCQLSLNRNACVVVLSPHEQAAGAEQLTADRLGCRSRTRTSQGTPSNPSPTIDHRSTVPVLRHGPCQRAAAAIWPLNL